MRADGKKVTNLSAIVSVIPYIMPRRYDAQNYITEYIDMEVLRKYLQRKRREGTRISYMSLILAAYFKSYERHPQINRFIMHKRIYQRNHFCVSFVILKKRADGSPDETTLKVFFEPGDDIISINEKLSAIIHQNQEAQHDNSTDKFANFMFSVPLLPGFVVGLARLLDQLNLLPRKIIDLSPFHTSLFVTNLASINTSYIYHHCYDFGTTGVFLCMGKPVPNYIDGERRKKMMPIGVVMDERICTGDEFAQFWHTYRSYIRHPETLENGVSAECPDEPEDAANVPATEPAD